MGQILRYKERQSVSNGLMQDNRGGACAVCSLPPENGIILRGGFLHWFRGRCAHEDS